VDATSVYWTDTSSILQCPLSGCGGVHTILASNQVAPGGIAIDATNVYWANGDGDVLACAKAGCGGSPTTLATGQAFGVENDCIAADGINVYWATPNLVTDAGPPNGTIVKCAASGCGGAPTVLASGQTPSAVALGCLGVDANTVYWVSWGDAAGTDSVRSCAIDGCGDAPSTLVSGLGGANSLAVDGTNVYVEDVAGVYQCSVTGCGNTPTYLGANAALQLTYDGSNVYWSNNTLYGFIYSCAIGGCGGAPTVVVPTVYNPISIALGPTTVYWSDQDGHVLSAMK